MSTKALFWALEQRIPTNPKMVLIMLADWYNEKESCAWPTIAELEVKTGLKRTAVKTSIRWLEERNLVVRDANIRDGWQVANRYRL